MTPDRDKNGRFTTDGPLKEKVIGIRVTAADYKTIKEAEKKGVHPRDVIVMAAKKAIKANE